MSSLALSLPISGRDSASAAGIGWLSHLQHLPPQAPRGRWWRSTSRPLQVTAAWVRRGKKREYPWPKKIEPHHLKDGALALLNPFKPLPEPPKPVVLPFEKKLVDLEKQIADVRKMSEELKLDFSDQIQSLVDKYTKARKRLYSRLTPIQRVQIARHPNRPTTLDHILNITDRWVELHGDRAGYDDPAIVTGLGRMNGKTYMFIGHQKGRNTKENIQRNFGMPTPHGYRKALRLMRYADHHGFPIITLIDTPGAFADLKSEELGQGEAIAFNLREMFRFKVPIVSVVIGEGGSGGALAIGCANRLLMMENSVFYVASPEACAAIIWKKSTAAAKAARKLKITATALRKLEIADGIIREPLGGAHVDPAWSSQRIKIALTRAMEELGKMDVETLLKDRQHKFRKLGGFQEGLQMEPVKKRNMKKRDVGLPTPTDDGKLELKQTGEESLDPNAEKPGASQAEVMLEQLKKELEKEIPDAFAAMGLKEKFDEIVKGKPKLFGRTNKVRLDALSKAFMKGLSQPGAFPGLKEKIKLLRVLEKNPEAYMLTLLSEKRKQEINDRIQEKMKDKAEFMRTVREKLAQGEVLNEDEVEKVAAIKEELQEILKSENLEVVESLPLLGQDVEEKIAKAEAMVNKEIKKAVATAGMKEKINQLKKEMKRGASKERIEQLQNEIREGIEAAMNLDEIKAKVEAQIGQTSNSSPDESEDVTGGNGFEQP